MQYKYNGDGAGVPGLPHEINDEQAVELGVQDLLSLAIEAGVYAPVSTATPRAMRAGKVQIIKPESEVTHE